LPGEASHNRARHHAAASARIEISAKRSQHVGREHHHVRRDGCRKKKIRPVQWEEYSSLGRAMKRHAAKNVGIPKREITRSHNVRGAYAEWYVEDYAVVRRDHPVTQHRAKEVEKRRQCYGSGGQIVGINFETKTG